MCWLDRNVVWQRERERNRKKEKGRERERERETWKIDDRSLEQLQLQLCNKGKDILNPRKYTLCYLG